MIVQYILYAQSSSVFFWFKVEGEETMKLLIKLFQVRFYEGDCITGCVICTCTKCWLCTFIDDLDFLPGAKRVYSKRALP